MEGIKVKNNKSEIQIDSTYRNFSKSEEGSETISNDNTDSGFYTTVNISDSSLFPLILLQPNTDDFLFLQALTRSGANFTSFQLTTVYSQSTAINWKTYLETPSKSAENYGLRVYKRNQDLVFDSGKSYFKIHSVHSVSLGNPTFTSEPYEDKTHSSISDPFYILSPGSYWLKAEYNPQYNYTLFKIFKIGIKKISATSIRVGWFCCRRFEIGGNLSANEGYNVAQKLIVCEV